jgi:shikimate dehydrogenase
VTLPSLIRAGLIGRGIGGSASPSIHQGEGSALGLNLRYELFDFDRLGLEDDDLGPFLDRLANEGHAGANVTHPFKQAVIPLLDALDPPAELLGAVNCISFSGGAKRGFNSDMSGFAFLLEYELAEAKMDCVAQVGAGGAGSATAFALLSSGVRQLRLFDTAHSRAHDLEARLGRSFPTAGIVVSDTPEAALNGADGIVQTTPIGMDAHPGTPFDPALVGQNQWLADIIYFPRETELVRAVKARGVRAVGGSTMVVGQASQPFRLFTGHEPDRERMLASFLAADRSCSRKAEKVG